MTEYKTFDDYVKNTFTIEPRELTHISPEEQKKKTVVITVDELINIWNELTELKAGSPKWHKVADGDLPEDNRTVLDEEGDRFYYFRGHFYYESDSRSDCQPIAWCEIPQYTD